MRTPNGEDFESVTALLESGVLYGTAPAVADLVQHRTAQLVTRRVKVPRTIRIWCSAPDCGAVMNWDLLKPGRGSSSEAEEIAFGDTKTFTYLCRHTPTASRVTFVLNVHESREMQGSGLAPVPAAGAVSALDVQVILIGRLPRPTPHIDSDVAESFGEIDLYLYEQALASRLSGMGIGAMTYMRRVVENEMNRLLDFLVAEISLMPENVEKLKRAKELQDENAFAAKARVADLVLPPTLFPHNQNPFSKLHDLCSEGVHQLDDVESCERFDEAKDLFDLLFQRLLHERESRRLYSENLRKLSSRKRTANPDDNA
jgi:hypothetical protein